MNNYIALSERSQNFIKKFYKLKPSPILDTWQNSDTNLIPTEELLNWLNQNIETDKYSHYPLEELRLSFLQDVQEALLTPEELLAQNKRNATPWYTNSQFIILAIAGTVLAFCDGFNGITSILALFNPVPMAIFTVGVAFSLISVAIFRGLDLVEISRNVGVKINNSKALLGTLVKQVEVIEEIRKKIDDVYVDSEDREQLKNYHHIVKTLLTRFNEMDEARKLYTDSMNNRFIHMAQFGAALVTGTLFFSSGFFAGQSLALAIAELFVATASATFFPVLLASLAVGVAAFCVYWYLERPGVENIVGRMFGLDKDQVEELSDEEKVQSQLLVLKQLDKKLDKYLKSQDRIEQLSTEVQDLAELNNDILTQVTTEPTVPASIGKSRYSHFNPHSISDNTHTLDDEENRLEIT